MKIFNALTSTRAFSWYWLGFAVVALIFNYDTVFFVGSIIMSTILGESAHLQDKIDAKTTIIEFVSENSKL